MSETDWTSSGRAERPHHLRRATPVAAQLEGRGQRQPERADLGENGREQDDQREVAAVLDAEDARREDPADDEHRLARPIR